MQNLLGCLVSIHCVQCVPGLALSLASLIRSLARFSSSSIDYACFHDIADSA